jgi:hypothetical protein
MLQPTHRLHVFLVFKIVCHHFQRGLTPPLSIGGTYFVAFINLGFVLLHTSTKID